MPRLPTLHNKFHCFGKVFRKIGVSGDIQHVPGNSTDSCGSTQVQQAANGNGIAFGPTFLSCSADGVARKDQDQAATLNLDIKTWSYASKIAATLVS